MFLLLIVVIVLPAVASDDEQYTALHFGTSSNDYIGFTYNMAPFQDSFSICSWIKRVDTSASYPLVLNYGHVSGSNEILITSNGGYNYVVYDGDLNSKQSAFTTPVGSWFNYCITWSLASRSINLYLDGNLIGTGTTDSGRTLKMGGTLFFNRLSYSTSSNHIFGGQIHQFNIFSEALSSADVKKIAEGGMCSDLTEFSGTGDLRWEHILSLSRSGSVREVEMDIDGNDMNCKPREKLITLLKRSQEELANFTGRLNETESQLSETEDKLNTTIEELRAVRGKLNSTEEKLDMVSSDLNKTEAAMESVIGQLNSTQEELNTTREKLGTVKDVLNVTQEELNSTQEELQTESAQHNKTGEKLDTCSTSLTSTLTNITGRLNERESQLSETEDKLNTTIEELRAVRGELNSTEEKLDMVSSDLNKIEAAMKSVTGQLNSTQEELQTESAQHNRTGEKLDTCSTSLTSTLTQLETARTFKNITRWDVLYTTPYYNKVLTEELFQQLSSSWGMLGKFVGTNITEGIVDHFRQYHQEPVCDVFEQLSYPMLRQFEGVELTKNINDHLRDTHLVNREDSPCESGTES